MVTLVVASFVVMGISMTFISQAQQYQAHASRRSVQVSARTAMTFLEDVVKGAGYGVDPDRAIIAFDSYDAAANAQSATDYPDAITVYARDPMFNRYGKMTSANEFTFDDMDGDGAPEALTEPIPLGQVMLILCPGASSYRYGVVSVAGKVDDTKLTLTAAGELAKETPVSISGNLFRGGYEEPNLRSWRADLNGGGASCTTKDGAAIFKIDRWSFYVAAFEEDGQANAGPSSLQTPYLMLHRGLDLSGPSGEPDGTVDVRDASPVAAGVEQLQISYAIQAPLAGEPLVLGVDPALGAITFGTDWNNNGLAPLWREVNYMDASRLTSHPANIRQVRITLVARTTSPVEAVAGDNLNTPGQSWTQGQLASGAFAWRQLENLGGSVKAVFNPSRLTAAAGLKGGFLRVPLRISVSPKNLLARSQYLPVPRSKNKKPVIWGG